jgi:hypothetical protein
MIPKKFVRLIQGGNRFSEKIAHKASYGRVLIKHGVCSSPKS